MFNKTAIDAFNSENKSIGIITLCKELDDAIGNGIPLGVITELNGSPGSGKTALSLQLCVNVQIPRIIEGLEGAAVYIDTNRGFTINRLKELADACAQQCNNIFNFHRFDCQMSVFDASTIMDNINCVFCNHYVELLATVLNLRAVLTKNPRIRLIVIDSFSYLFRVIENSLDRTRLICQMCTDLQKLAMDFQCAVVLTDEITTRIINSEAKYITPALGDGLGHRMNYQITLGRDLHNKELFYANIDKSFYSSESMVPFRINQNGIKSKT